MKVSTHLELRTIKGQEVEYRIWTQPEVRALREIMQDRSQRKQQMIRAGVRRFPYRSFDSVKAMVKKLLEVD